MPFILKNFKEFIKQRHLILILLPFVINNHNNEYYSLNYNFICVFVCTLIKLMPQNYIRIGIISMFF